MYKKFPFTTFMVSADQKTNLEILFQKSKVQPFQNTLVIFEGDTDFLNKLIEVGKSKILK